MDTEKAQDQRTERERLGERLVEIGNATESLFAEALVYLLDAEPGDADELRVDDYRVHDRCVDLDAACVEVLSGAAPQEATVRVAQAAVRMGDALKRVADEAVRVGRRLREVGPEVIAEVPGLPGVTQLAQEMLGEAVGALVNRDAHRAAALRLAGRELAERAEGARRQLLGQVQEHHLSIPQAVALVGLEDALWRIGREAVAFAAQVGRFYGESLDKQ